MVHNAKKIKINCLEFKDTPSAHAHKQTHIYIIQNFLKTLLEEKNEWNDESTIKHYRRDNKII